MAVIDKSEIGASENSLVVRVSLTVSVVIRRIKPFLESGWIPKIRNWVPFKRTESPLFLLSQRPGQL
jgi:hypothetical protein